MSHARKAARPSAILFIILLTLLFSFSGSPSRAADRPCPWTISSMGVGKWANGNHKASIWVSGSFPRNLPGSTERPDWFINGKFVGKSQAQIENRMIPNSSAHLVPGTNTITVKFTSPPYKGASHTLTIQDFDWSKVPNGGYRYYRGH